MREIAANGSSDPGGASKYINHKPYCIFKSHKLKKAVYINKGEHIGNKPTINSDFDEQEF